MLIQVKYWESESASAILNEQVQVPPRFPGFPLRWSIQIHGHVAVGQNQWYHFGVGAPPLLVDFNGDWDVHCDYGIRFMAVWVWVKIKPPGGRRF